MNLGGSFLDEAPVVGYLGCFAVFENLIQAGGAVVVTSSFAGCMSDGFVGALFEPLHLVMGKSRKRRSVWIDVEYATYIGWLNLGRASSSSALRA